MIATDWTVEEVYHVLLAMREPRQRVVMTAPCYGRVVFTLSRDTGFGAGWLPAARLALRLQRGEPILAQRA
jgi:hypothetical protein